MIDYLKELKRACKFEDVSFFTDPVLCDERFSTWSGAGSNKHHHYGDGGLLKHTHEVYEYAQSIYGIHNGKCERGKEVNWKELLISISWHDYGKIWDYQKDDNGVWGKHDNHARTIHHISRSAIEWEKFINIKCFDKSLDTGINVLNVTHNILSHHGMREWGSPVAPATREAWILHLADNLSARLDDCDKHDILNH